MSLSGGILSLSRQSSAFDISPSRWGRSGIAADKQPGNEVTSIVDGLKQALLACDESESFVSPIKAASAVPTFSELCSLLPRSLSLSRCASYASFDDLVNEDRGTDYAYKYAFRVEDQDTQQLEPVDEAIKVAAQQSIGPSVEEPLWFQAINFENIEASDPGSYVLGALPAQGMLFSPAEASSETAMCDDNSEAGEEEGEGDDVGSVMSSTCGDGEESDCATVHNPEDEVVVGIYSRKERAEKIRIFNNKRKLRCFDKKTLYEVRKKFANKRLRVGGRFVPKAEVVRIFVAFLSSFSTLPLVLFPVAHMVVHPFFLTLVYC